MSKSYKKTPICKFIRNKTKRFANRAVRRARDIPPNGAYKKCYCSWMIFDSAYYKSYSQHKAKIIGKMQGYENGGEPFYCVDDYFYSDERWASMYYRK